MNNQFSASRLFFVASFALLLIGLVTFKASAQSETTGGMSAAETDRIIKAFTNKEIQFRRALNQYSFKRDALIQSIGLGGQITGEYHRISMFTFDDSGNRYEKISFFP